MDCRECSREMTAFLDDELSRAEAREVRSHVDVCRACTRELAALREAGDLVRTHHRQLEPHPAGWTKVLAHLDNTGETSRFGWPAHVLVRWQPVAIALTGLGLMIGLWSYQRHVESQRALEHYMIQYVQAREVQEQRHRHPGSQQAVTDSAHPETGDVENPFVLVRQTTEGNPFRR